MNTFLNQAFLHKRIRAMAFLLLFAISLCTGKPVQKEVWQIRENLLTRLSGEWYKINILTKELSSANDIMADMRDLELFPIEVTRCSEDSLVAFDKKLELAEKRYHLLQKQVTALKNPLSDGCSILREMVIGQPVEDMFTVLDNENIMRISQMLTIKHSINSLWKNIDTLTSTIASHMKVTLQTQDPATTGLDKEFFEILSSNLGEKTKWHFKQLDDIKTQLRQRASDADAEQMYQIEIHRVKEILNLGQTNLADRKLSSLVQRYTKVNEQNELCMLKVKTFFKNADYDSVLHNASTTQVSFFTQEMKTDLLLYKLQSMYALCKFDTVWQWGQKYSFDTLLGAKRNCAIWMVLESGLAMKQTSKFAEIASHVVKDTSYSLHVLHALGRYYVSIHDYKNALSVFESAAKFKRDNDLEKKAYSKILLCIAQTLFENNEYAKSLSRFFEILNSEDESVFADALFGISWCYIKLGMNQKAEMSFRKLINQVPSSPLAVRALLVLGNRSLNKAQFEWDKLVFLTNAENRLATLKATITSKMTDSSGRAKRDKLQASASKIEDMLSRFKTEKRENAQSVVALYEEIPRLTSLISQYYTTGSYQEISFSQKREYLLHRLDSLILDIKNGSDKNSSLQSSIAKLAQSKSTVEIKNLVMKAKVFNAQASIDRFRWEKEHLDWNKGLTIKALDACKKEARMAKDSTTVLHLEETRRALNVRMDSLVRIGDRLHIDWYDKLTKTCEDLTSQQLDTADDFYLRYHDAEMHYVHENQQYAVKYGQFESDMSIYDSLLTLFRQNKIIQMPTRPKEPVLSHDSSTMQYKIILARYPANELAYAARYSLAWCYNDVNKFDSAIANMNVVVTKYPSCQYAPQAWMYIGEYMFDKSKLDNALKAYQAVLNYPESEWFDKALYKLAWAQYRLSNPEKAISSFLALVDLGNKSPLSKSLLEKESIDYIAISFSETDITGEKGLERATNFVRKFGDASKGTQILHRLATIYKEQGRYDMAQKTYRSLLKQYPEYQQSPQIESELFAVLEKSSTIDETNIRNMEFFTKYNRNAEWAKAQADPRMVAKADSLAENHLYNAAESYHQLALQKSDTLLYQTAADGYEEYIKNYPKAMHAGECHYNLAEIQFSLGKYERAAEEYMAVSRRYNDLKYKEMAAWNAIVASQNLLKKEGEKLR